jgi:long-subunit fatty acid transport protein
LRAGISYERLYFKNNKLNYIKDSDTHVDTLVDSTNIKLSSNAFSAGLMYTINNTLTLGISGKYYAKGTARVKNYLWGVDRYIDTTITKTTDGTYDTSIVPKEKTIVTKSSCKVSLPPLLSLGVSYKLSPEWLVAADVDITFWDKYSSDIPMHYENESGLSNAANFSIGTQYIPAPNLLTPKYYEIIQYRGGFRFTRLPGSEAYETALTLGTGLPLKQGGGIFDLFIEVGRRWDKRFSGLSENFFGINIGLNGGQKWFQTTEEGY